MARQLLQLCFGIGHLLLLRDLYASDLTSLLIHGVVHRFIILIFPHPVDLLKQDIAFSPSGEGPECRFIFLFGIDLQQVCSQHLMLDQLIDLRGKLLLQLLQRILFILGIDQRDMLIRDDKMRKQGMRSSAACAPDAKDTDNDERIDLSDIKAPGVIRVTMKAATMCAMGTR